MERISIFFIMVFLCCCTNKNDTSSQQGLIMKLHPIAAFIKADGRTEAVDTQSLSDLPVYSAMYEPNFNKVLVMYDNKTLPLDETSKGIFYKKVNSDSTEYSMEATVHNGKVSSMIFTWSKDNYILEVKHYADE